MKRILVIAMLPLMAAIAAAQTTTAEVVRDSAAAVATGGNASTIKIARPTGKSTLQYPRSTWAVAASAGVCAVVTGFCIIKANGSYNRYRAAATVGEMQTWRDRTTRYDRTAYVAGIMTASLTCVSISLFTIRTGGVTVGLDMPEEGHGRHGIVIAGRF